MDIFEALRLIAATGCGIQIGGFLLLSLFHKPLFDNWPDDMGISWLFKRFYRFNTVISIISGVIAILGEARAAGFLLAILGMSYTLLLTHLMPALLNQNRLIDAKTNLDLRRSPKEIINILGKTQQITHFCQLSVLIYIIYMLLN